MANIQTERDEENSSPLMNYIMAYLARTIAAQLQPLKPKLGYRWTGSVAALPEVAAEAQDQEEEEEDLEEEE